MVSTARSIASCQSWSGPSAGRAREQRRELVERRRDGVGDGLQDRLAPRLRACRHDQQRAAAAVRPHRHRELDQHVEIVARRSSLPEPEERQQQRRTIRQVRRRLVDDLERIALQHEDVDELARFGASMLDDEQAGLGDLEDETEQRDVTRRAPDPQLVSFGPHAEVNARAFDRRRQLGEPGRRQRQVPLESQRRARVLGPQERERDLRREPFLAAQARPERGVDDGFDGVGIRRRRRGRRAIAELPLEVADEDGRRRSGRGVTGFGHDAGGDGADLTPADCAGRAESRRGRSSPCPRPTRP